MRDIGYYAHCFAAEGTDVRGSLVNGVLVRGDVIDADVEAIGGELDGYAFATVCSVSPLRISARREKAMMDLPTCPEWTRSRWRFHGWTILRLPFLRIVLLVREQDEFADLRLSRVFD